MNVVDHIDKALVFVVGFNSWIVDVWSGGEVFDLSPIELNKLANVQQYHKNLTFYQDQRQFSFAQQ